MSTTLAKPAEMADRKWYVIDAAGKPLAQLLEELLRRVGCVADGRTRGQWHLPSELHDRGDDASENTCECCDAILAALGIGLNECHVTSMKAAS